jgi:hypothetical protein
MQRLPHTGKSVLFVLLLCRSQQIEFTIRWVVVVAREEIQVLLSTPVHLYLNGRVNDSNRDTFMNLEDGE